MAVNPAYEDQDAVESSADPRPDELTELARELMRRAREASPPAVEDEPRVLMDVESDGLRCVLVRTDAPRRASLLSPREQEIARMIARGLPNKTIAAVLEISSWTVGTHLRRMFAKLNVTSRAALVAKLAQDAQQRMQGDRDENSHS